MNSSSSTTVYSSDNNNDTTTADKANELTDYNGYNYQNYLNDDTVVNKDDVISADSTEDKTEMSAKNPESLLNLSKSDVTGDAVQAPWLSLDELQNNDTYKGQFYYDGVRNFPNARTLRHIIDHIERPYVLDRPIKTTVIKETNNSYPAPINSNLEHTSYYIIFSWIFFIIISYLIVIFILYLKD